MLANDARYDARQQAEVADLPEVATAYPFLVAFALEVASPSGLDSAILPTTAPSQDAMAGVLVEGRLPDPDRPDEAIVNEAVRAQYGVGIGDTITVVQQLPDDTTQFPVAPPPDASQPIEQALRIVGISDSTDDTPDWMPSAGFYKKYEPQLIGFVNQMIALRNGEADFAKFQSDVQRVTGRPTNVERGSDLFGVRQLTKVADVVRNGLLLFALAVIIGAGVLVGQALVRAVSAGATDLPTWRALGCDRRIAVRAIVAPTAIVAGVGAITTVVVAIALSPRFPIAIIRRYELDIGLHADWAVLGGAVLLLVAGVLVSAYVTAEILVRRSDTGRAATPLAARWAIAAGLRPSLLIGSRLAVDAGRGRRAIPVRSALVGAIVGVIGVVGCLTFRNGLSDAATEPMRSGVVWDYSIGTIGAFNPDMLDTIASDDAVAAACEAKWARAVDVDGTSTPTFGTSDPKPGIEFVILAGRAPRDANEIAFAPTTMRVLGVDVGDTVHVGPERRAVQVVGRVLLPRSSHTEYDQSAWMTAEGLQASLPPADQLGDDFFESYTLVRWKPGADVAAAITRLAPPDSPDFYASPAALPQAVDALGDLRSLPLTLAIFFALLAIATVAHALVTTVRRRRHEFAVLRSIGFTRRNTRGRDRVAVDVARDRGTGDRYPARHHRRPAGLEAGRRGVPGRLRAAIGTRRDPPHHPDRDRRRQRTRGRTRPRGDAHPPRTRPADGVMLSAAPELKIHRSLTKALKLFDADRLRWLDEAAAAGPARRAAHGSGQDVGRHRSRRGADDARDRRRRRGRGRRRRVVPIRVGVGENLFTQSDKAWAEFQPLVAPAFRKKALDARLAEHRRAHRRRGRRDSRPTRRSTSSSRWAGSRCALAAWVLLGEQLDATRAEEIAHHQREVVGWVGVQLGELTASSRSRSARRGTRDEAPPRRARRVRRRGHRAGRHDACTGDDVLGALLRARPWRAGRSRRPSCAATCSASSSPATRPPPPRCRGRSCTARAHPDEWAKVRDDPGRAHRPFLTEIAAAHARGVGHPAYADRAGVTLTAGGRHDTRPTRSARDGLPPRHQSRPEHVARPVALRSRRGTTTDTTRSSTARCSRSGSARAAASASTSPWPR